MAAGRRRRAILERAGLVLASLVMTAALLEVGLRAAGALIGSRVDAGGRAGALAIACVGDSHTYGIYYGPEQSYPGRLQVLLDDRAPGRYHVVNLGSPGANSSQVAAQLSEAARRYHPYAAVICAGVNDVWNELDGGVHPRQGRARRVLYSLRLYKLALVLGARLRPAEALPAGTGRRSAAEQHAAKAPSPPPADAGGKARARFRVTAQEGLARRTRDDAAARAALARDLEEMRTMALASGIRPVLLTYGTFPAAGRFAEHAAMNAEMRAFAARAGIAVVDVEPDFRAALAGGAPRATIFATEVESHPNARGYDLIARKVADLLEPPR